MNITYGTEIRDQAEQDGAIPEYVADNGQPGDQQITLWMVDGERVIDTNGGAAWESSTPELFGSLWRDLYPLAKCESLVALLDRMRLYPDGADWPSDAPTFGGDEPVDTSGIWSWDKDSLLVGTCAHDLEITARAEEDGGR